MSYPTVLVEPVLVGREHELAELQSYLELAINRNGKVVFISGEAGAGKTRLVKEFLNAAKKRDVTVLTGWCLSNAAVPYFPFFEAFKAYFSGGLQESSEPEALDLRDVLIGPDQSEKRVGVQTVSPQVWKDQTFLAVARTLSAISARNPVVLFIDDLQWADSASLALIHYLARATSYERVLVLATFRSEQLPADAEGRSHPLIDTLREMRREDLFAEIKVANLSNADVSLIAKNMIGGDLQPALAEKLTDRSQGNPLFVVESLRMLDECKGLVKESDQWRLIRGEIGIPTKIKDIILQRLESLSSNQKEALEAASVIGEEFSVELLASVLDQDSLGTIKTLDAIAKNTSLVRCEGGLYKFDHSRSKDALYEEISPVLRKGYHAKIAEKLESSVQGTKTQLSALAYHYAQAENSDKAVRYALAAGQNALARWSNTEAVQHFDCVLKTAGNNPAYAGERMSALEGLGDAFFSKCMYKEATKIFEEFTDASETNTARLRGLRKAIKSSILFGNHFHAMELGKKAEQYTTDRLENARIQAETATVMGHKTDRVLKDLVIALSVFEEEYSISDIASVLFMLGVLNARVGKLHEGLAESLRSISLFKELGDFRSQMEAYFFAGLTFMSANLFKNGYEMFEKIFELDEKTKMGDYLRLTDANVWSSIIFYSEGNNEKALEYGLRALELSKKTDSVQSRGSAYVNLVVLYTRLGDLKRAEEYYGELMKLPPEILDYNLVRGKIAQAVFFAGKNQWEKSTQYFDECFKRIASNPDPGPEAAIRLMYAWALEKQGRYEEAKIQLEAAKKIRQRFDVNFERSTLQVHLTASRQAVIGKDFEMRIDIVNVSRESCEVIKISSVLPPEFTVAKLPPFYTLQDGQLFLKQKVIDPFTVETIKLRLTATKAGTYSILPVAFFLDDLAETKTLKLNPITLIVQPAQPSYEILPGRLTTGYSELDGLLSGGIPEGYAVVLAASSSDERQQLIKRFLEAGADAGKITFHITGEVETAKSLAEKYPLNFYLFLCNPRADMTIQNLPNVFKLKGVENLTEVDIALTKAFRTLSSGSSDARRACIEIVSDALLQHHALITRKWLSALLQDLKSKGFTTIAVIDPRMHPSEETQAILSLFEGEIHLLEKESVDGKQKILKITKLYNKPYSEKELVLPKKIS